MNILTDKKYIINLSRRPDRKAHILEQMDKLGFKNYEFFEAIDANDIKENPTQEHFTKQQLACLRSHLAVIKKAKELNLEHVTIIEDDCVFVDNFKKLYKQIVQAQTPNYWRMFYLAANHAIQPIPIRPNIARCEYAQSTVCYVVRNTYYDLIISELSKEDASVDYIFINRLHDTTHSKNESNRITALCAIPNLCSQLSGYSDIEQKEVNYENFYKKEL